jgi:DUF4097 and DUF4098 domain-containing protein YvlB
MKYLTICILLFTSIALNAGTINETKELKLKKTGITKLQIKSGAGDVKIEGKKDLDEIQVTAVIQISGVDEDDRDKILDKWVDLSLEKSGSKAYLTSIIEGNRGFFRRSRSAKIDLTINIPEEVALSVNDGAGDVELKNVAANVYLDDGSGFIDIQNISGDLEIDDGSGDLEINTVQGLTDIVDGSGTLYLENITGDVIIDDGSGSMRIEQVDGNVKISDGSGSIKIDDVSKDVTIKEKGSGSVTIHNVKGSVHRYDD